MYDSGGDNRVRVDTAEGSSIAGGLRNDSIVGGRVDDTLIGGPGRDTLCGGAGDDKLCALYELPPRDPPPTYLRNVLDGGPGADRYLRERDVDALIDVEIHAGS